MAEQVVDQVPVEDEELYEDDSLATRFMDWVRTEMIWYAGSFTVHLLGLSMLLLLGNFTTGVVIGDAPSFEEASQEKEHKDATEEELKKFDVGEIEEEQPAELDVDPTLEKPGQAEVKEDYIDDNPVYIPAGGGMATGDKDSSVGGAGGFNVIAYGPGAKVTGGGIGVGLGTGKDWGSGGSGVGFGGRGQGHRKAMVAQFGGTKRTERAVTGALIWLARHQMQDGSWSLDHSMRCSDKTCTGASKYKGPTGATAMGLLPFLAAGQTHRYKGPYQGTIAKGINWLIRHQKPSGDLAADNDQPLYSHGLATIALCEAYGLTQDRNIGLAAQGAVNYILAAQNKTTGGWRYVPGEEGDTSVVGWQLMALKSAMMAGLSVGGSNVEAIGSKWLESVKSGEADCQFAYQPGQGGTPTMTSVGLLCRQYLGMKRESPTMKAGMKYLLTQQPDAAMPNMYYWYYATQVMHNLAGYEWDTWNRKMRKILVETQSRTPGTCASGSWAPEKDPWAGGDKGGRLMMTSLAALTLEIYYRYLPLYKIDTQMGGGGGAAEKEGPKKDIGEVMKPVGGEKPAEKP